MIKLIKNKQGASKFFEFLMLFPFCLYIVLLSLYKIIGMIAYDNLADYSFEITRETIVERDFENALNEMAKNRNQTLAQMALAWVYSHKGVTSVLIGASKPEQIVQNLKMTDNFNFTEEEYKQIDSIVL